LPENAAKGYAKLARSGLSRKAATAHRDVPKCGRHTGAAPRGYAAARATGGRLACAQILPCDIDERHGSGLPYRHLPGKGHQTCNGLEE